MVSLLSLTDHLGIFSSPLPVFCLSGDDCLWSECFLQLPGLARSGQQCSYKSDGWGLLLSQLSRGLSCCWVLAQGHHPILPDSSSPALQRNRPKLARMGCQEPAVGTSYPPPLIQQKVTGDVGSHGSALSEDFSIPGWATLLTSTKCTNRPPASNLP